MTRHENDFSRALEEVVQLAPYGSRELQERLMGNYQSDEGDAGVSGAVAGMMDAGFRDSGS
jgi:hypothetical protein